MRDAILLALLFLSTPVPNDTLESGGVWYAILSLQRRLLRALLDG